ncbi:hypothetical protein BGW37DRAFT_463335 [Umbelopsis sp. PMI_123]|nr:hypothetical protein BGW37DRAFT_463335 [Umbelopsis sp. PMI_123]
MSYVTSFIVLLLLSTGAADANLGDMPSDNPTVWQYIVIALSLAFAFMAALCNNFFVLPQSWSGARVYAPLPVLNEDELERIAIVEYSEGNTEEQSCSICLDLFRPKTKIRLLPCRHTFHPICIDPWLTKHSAECPMCKQSCVDYVRQIGLADHLKTLRNTLEPIASDSRTNVTTTTAEAS